MGQGDELVFVSGDFGSVPDVRFEAVWAGFGVLGQVAGQLQGTFGVDVFLLGIDVQVTSYGELVSGVCHGDDGVFLLEETACDLNLAGQQAHFDAVQLQISVDFQFSTVDVDGFPVGEDGILVYLQFSS